MKTRNVTIYILAALFVLTLVTAAITAMRIVLERPQPARAQAAAALQPLPMQPAFGWRVCGNLGEGEVPGLPEPRLRLHLCNPAGWEADAYCLQPEVDEPPLGSICEMNEQTGEFWCGNSYQMLALYAIVATPSPTPSATPTATATMTPTVTLTATPIFTLTRLPEDLTGTPSSTQRPRAGGKGGIDLVGVVGLVVLMGLLAGMTMVFFLVKSILDHR